MPALPALRVRRDDLWCFTWRNCMLHLWKQVTVDSLKAAYQVTQQLRGDFPQGLVTVSCMLPGSPLVPAADARAESLRLMKETSGVVKASAAVLEGSGLMVVAVRAFLSALTITASRADQHFKIFGSLAKVPGWIVPLMDPNPSPTLVTELGEALARARAIRGG